MVGSTVGALKSLRKKTLARLRRYAEDTVQTAEKGLREFYTKSCVNERRCNMHHTGCHKSSDRMPGHGDFHLNVIRRFVSMHLDTKYKGLKNTQWLKIPFKKS